MTEPRQKVVVIFLVIMRIHSGNGVDSPNGEK